LKSKQKVVCCRYKHWIKAKLSCYAQRVGSYFSMSWLFWRRSLHIKWYYNIILSLTIP